MKHEHVITFDGRPSILQITRALNEVEKVFPQYTKVAVVTDGASDPDMEQVTFYLETEK
jgi:hypothetical protein